MQGLLKMLQLSGASRLAGTQLVPQARPAVSRNMATTVKASVGKKDLVAAVAHNAGLTTAQAERAVNSVLGAIVETVAKGEEGRGRRPMYDHLSDWLVGCRAAPR